MHDPKQKRGIVCILCYLHCPIADVTLECLSSTRLNLKPEQLCCIVAYLGGLGLLSNTLEFERVRAAAAHDAVSAAAADGAVGRVVRRRIQQSKAAWTAMCGKEKRIKKELDQLQQQPIPNCSAGPAGIHMVIACGAVHVASDGPEVRCAAQVTTSHPGRPSLWDRREHPITVVFSTWM